MLYFFVVPLGMSAHIHKSGGGFRTGKPSPYLQMEPDIKSEKSRGYFRTVFQERSILKSVS